jgi:hypothetical protein
LARRHGKLPPGTATYVQESPALERELTESGFLDVARQDGYGLLEGVLLVEAMGTSPYAVEVATSAIVVPGICNHALKRPVAIAQGALGAPVRFLGNGGTALIDTGRDIRIVDLASTKTEPVPSSYNYPFARFVDLRPDEAPILEGADPEIFRALTRIALAAEIVGLAEPAIDIATEHVKTRQQFGRPLAAFQVIQHRLAECLVLLEGARLLVRQAAAMRLREGAALAAAYAQDAAAKIIRETHQFHGAIGLTLEYPLHYYTYRLRALIGELGGATAQAVAASTLLWRPDEAISDHFHARHTPF